MRSWWKPARSRRGVGDLAKGIGTAFDPAVRSARSRLRHDPFARLKDAVDLAVAADLGIAIDANRASADDWLRLPGLSIRQANLLAGLAAGGVPFHGLDDVAAALGVPVSRLEPYGAVLQFCYYDPDSVATVQPQPANDASAAALAALPAIDAALAAAIVTERTARGPFRSLADLQRRLRLSGEQTATLMYYLRF